MQNVPSHFEYPMHLVRAMEVNLEQQIRFCCRRRRRHWRRQVQIDCSGFNDIETTQQSGDRQTQSR